MNQPDLSQLCEVLLHFDDPDDSIRKQAHDWVLEFRDSDAGGFIRGLLHVISTDMTARIAIHAFIQLSRYLVDDGCSDLPPISPGARASLREQILALAGSEDVPAVLHSMIARTLIKASSSWPEPGDFFASLADGPFVADSLTYFADFPNESIIPLARAGLASQSDDIRSASLRFFYGLFLTSLDGFDSNLMFGVHATLPDDPFCACASRLLRLIKSRHTDFSDDDIHAWRELIAARAMDSERAEVVRVFCTRQIGRGALVDPRIGDPLGDFPAAFFEAVLADPSLGDLCSQALEVLDQVRPAIRGSPNVYAASAYLRIDPSLDDLDVGIQYAGADDDVVRYNGMVFLTRLMRRMPPDDARWTALGTFLAGATCDDAWLRAFEVWCKRASDAVITAEAPRVVALFDAAPGPSTLRCVAHLCARTGGEDLARGLLAEVSGWAEQAVLDALDVLPGLAEVAGTEAAAAFLEAKIDMFLATKNFFLPVNCWLW